MAPLPLARGSTPDHQSAPLADVLVSASPNMGALGEMRVGAPNTTALIGAPNALIDPPELLGDWLLDGQVCESARCPFPVPVLELCRFFSGLLSRRSTRSFIWYHMTENIL